MKCAKKRLPNSVVRDRCKKLVKRALELLAFFEEHEEEIYAKIRENVAKRFAVEEE